MTVAIAFDIQHIEYLTFRLFVRRGTTLDPLHKSPFHFSESGQFLSHIGQVTRRDCLYIGAGTARFIQ
jgi:hypothetical protein